MNTFLADSAEVVYFNNSRNRKHAELFQADAFFDLNTSGPQAKQALNLKAGQQCVVASKASRGSAKFIWYSLASERLMSPRDGDDGKKFRVFLGTKIREQELPISQALQELHYAVFFDKNGHFKRASTIRGARQKRVGR